MANSIEMRSAFEMIFMVVFLKKIITIGFGQERQERNEGRVVVFVDDTERIGRRFVTSITKVHYGIDETEVLVGRGFFHGVESFLCAERS